MTKRTCFGVLLIALLGFIYIRNYTNWFRKSQIEITVTSRPGRPGMAADDAAPIVFGLDRDYELRSIRVLSLSSLQTNTTPIPVWQIGTVKGKSHKARPPLLRGFPYGDKIEGLDPSTNLPEPQPLIPGHPYRIEVLSAGGHGEQDFTPAAAGE
jgi:hypothetical protein